MSRRFLNSLWLHVCLLRVKTVVVSVEGDSRRQVTESEAGVSKLRSVSCTFVSVHRPGVGAGMCMPRVPWRTSVYRGLMERMEPGRREARLGRRAGQRHTQVAQLERGQSCGVVSAGQPALPALCDTGRSLFAGGGAPTLAGVRLHGTHTLTGTSALYNLGEGWRRLGKA